MTPVPADEPRTNSVQVPGASASRVSSVCLWSSMPRWLLSSSLPLASFLRSLLSDVPAQEIPGTSPWPMPLPYPLVMKKGKIRTPRRRRALCIIVNLMTAALSFLACGRPSAPPPEVRGGKLSGEQRGIVRRLEAWAKVLVDLRIDCVTMGRAAAKVESMEKQVRALERVSAELLQNSAAGYGRPLKRRPATSSSHYENFREFSGEIKGSEDPPRFLDKGDEVVAKSIEVSRVQLKGQPSFCPPPYLDAESASHYEDPWRWMLSPAEVVDRPPRTRVFARPNEKMKLFSLLDQGKRLAIFDAEIALPDYSNGLFAVIKNQTKDRLVLDGRPPNSLERPTGAFLRSMACASALLPLFIPPTKVAVFAGEDISDYYYRFKVSRARSRRNILVGTVPQRICEQFQAFTDAKPFLTSTTASTYAVSLHSLAMGDLNAVTYGQTAHVGLLASHCGVERAELLSLDSSRPRSDQMLGVCIDDMVMLELVDKSLFVEGLEPEFSKHRLRQVRQAYQDVGLPTRRH